MVAAGCWVGRPPPPLLSFLAGPVLSQLPTKPQATHSNPTRADHTSVTDCDGHLLTMENGAATQGEGKDPSGFLSEIIGNPVTVKLNSGVVYKGKCCVCPSSPHTKWHRADRGWPHTDRVRFPVAQGSFNQWTGT